MKLEVCLNGTEMNPFHVHGLTQNPFSQVGKREWDDACLRMQKLGGDPIPDVEYIRKTLDGFSQEFIELCVSRFQKGKYVKFQVEFDDV